MKLIQYKKFSFEYGARYDFDKITPQIEKPNANIGFVRERIFNNYSLSLSILYQQSENVFLLELILVNLHVFQPLKNYSLEGPHLAAYSYEIGNPNLKSESGIGSEIFIYHQFEDLYFNLTFFRNELK